MARSRFSENAGPSQRQLRVGEVIRRALADILTRGEIHDPELNQFSITVAEVRTSPDLKIATAYVLPLGGKDRDAALLALRRNGAELRRAVSKSVSLKFSPQLRFEIDQTFDQMDKTRQMLADEAVRRDVESSD